MKTLISVKIDQDIKNQAQSLSKNLGIPLSTLVNAYLRQFVREEKATFTAAWQMSPELEKILGSGIRDKGPEISKKSSLAHTSVKTYLKQLKKLLIVQESVEKKGSRKFPLYHANIESHQYRKYNRHHGQTLRYVRQGDVHKGRINSRILRIMH